MIIVSNAGTHPEPAHLAAGLTVAGHNVRYYTTASWASDSMIMRALSAPQIADSAVAKQLKRRSLPPNLISKQVRNTSILLDSIHQLAWRRNLASKDNILKLRNWRHRRNSAHLIRQYSNVSTVVAQYHSGLELFKAAPPTATRILMYPIAHHAWMEATMAIEARSNPEWSDYLQGLRFTQREKSLMDREIDLADFIIVPSTFAKSTFIQVGISENKIVNLPLGADMPNRELPNPRRPGDNNEVTFLFAGQVNQRKGISYILDAFARLSASNARLIIAGYAEPSMLDRLKDYENVQYLGTMPRSDLARVMAKSDVILLPSLAEGFGLTAIEGMAAGCLPIVSKYTFASDIIEHGQNGFIIDARSIEQLYAIMEYVVNNLTVARQMGSRARESAEKFTWTDYQKRASSIIRDLDGLRTKPK